MALGDSLNCWNSPLAIRRTVRNYLLAAILASGAAVALALMDEILGIPRQRLGAWGRYGPLALGLFPIVVLFPMFLRWRRRLHAQFTNARGRLCTHCAYNVGPLGECGTCPECGQPFDAHADAALWEAAGFTCEP